MKANKKFRSHYCGKINESDINKSVIVCGWIHSITNIGKIKFIKIRDESGIIQAIIDNENIACNIKKEYVVKLEGIIRKKISKKNLSEIEILTQKIFILNKASDILPFYPSDNTNINENLIMKYRYIYLRKKEVVDKLKLRSYIINDIRKILNKNNFIEVETPILTKHTPEGARDYIIPSRINKGCFFALPQSPQLFKQILMISGIEKYYQIAKCFRDEDLRADRQPEFTQLDMELAFTNEKEITKIIEKIIKYLIKKYTKTKIKNIKQISYKKSIKLYASEKPDIRNNLLVNDINKKLKNTPMFVKYNKKKHRIAYIKTNDEYNYISEKILNLYVKKNNNENYYYIKIEKTQILSNIKNTEYIKDIENELKLSMNDIVIIIINETNIANEKLNEIRTQLYKDLKFTNNSISLIWITKFPLFKIDKNTKKYHSFHHPFTSPEKKYENIKNMKNKNLKSRSYDLILNGTEIGGGSIRIHDSETQKYIFNVLGLTDEEIEEKFGFFIEALKFGAPPMGGIALGLDRLIMMISKSTSIKEVIAFPKTYKCKCLLTGAPSKL